MPGGDKRCNKNVAPATRLSFRGIVTELSTLYRFSSTLPRDEGMNYLDTLFRLSVFLFLSCFFVFMHYINLSRRYTQWIYVFN